MAKLAISWSYPGIIDQNLAILVISLFIREAVKNTIKVSNNHVDPPLKFMFEAYFGPFLGYF